MNRHRPNIFCVHDAHIRTKPGILSKLKTNYFCNLDKMAVVVRGGRGVCSLLIIVLLCPLAVCVGLEDLSTALVY